MTLTDFLLARIAEDEEVARACDLGGWNGVETMGAFDGGQAVLMDPARALARCEADKRIVERVTHALAEGTYPDLNRRERSQGHRTLCDLAAPYAGHPDYREEWGAVSEATCDHPGIDHDAQWSYCWPCPKCGVCKFIGHGPLCADCYRESC